MRAADIPRVIALDGGRANLPWSMMVKEWHWWPDDREAMVADPPLSDSADDLCRIAALVHALCDQDNVALPGWALEHRSELPLSLFSAIPTSGRLWERMVAEAPAVCEHHNVWFTYRDIESPKAAIKRLRKLQRRRR